LEPIDLAAKLQQIDGLWDPRIVGYFNDCKLQLVKVKGEFVWRRGTPNTGDAAGVTPAPEIEL
jgi:hypothetical protein